MREIVITTPTFGKFTEQPKVRLREAGYTLTHFEQSKVTEADILSKVGNDTIAIITGIEPITAKIMDASPNLKAIAKHGIGVDNIDLQAAKERGIGVYNTPGANADAVADLAVGFMFVLARDIVQVNRAVLEGSWPRHFGSSVWGATLGVLGFGAIGKKTALRGRGLNMRVLAYDPYLDVKFSQAHGIEQAGIEDILKSSDFLTIHMPLTGETLNMISAKELCLMKKTAFIINTARGGIINESDLYAALKDKVIAGAALDAFESEPPADRSLLELPNVVSTPHMGGYTYEAINNMSNGASDTVIAVLSGNAVPNRIVYS